MTFLKVDADRNQIVEQVAQLICDRINEPYANLHPTTKHALHLLVDVALDAMLENAVKEAMRRVEYSNLYGEWERIHCKLRAALGGGTE